MKLHLNTLKLQDLLRCLFEVERMHRAKRVNVKIKLALIQARHLNLMIVILISLEPS